MNFSHPTITIETPAPGHYVVTGHNPAPVFIPDEGTVVPPRETYIAPELPDEVLEAILADRAEQRGDEFSEESNSTQPKKPKK